MVAVPQICVCFAVAFIAVASSNPVPEPGYEKGGHHVHHIIHVPEYHHTRYVHEVKKVPIYIKEKVYVHHHEKEQHHYDHHDQGHYEEPISYSSHGHGWDRR
uniref:Histidine-rich glycoprotein n=1 Tax=Cacopsylla melanoneura TaxID=428564 RepID=A0A8D8QG38_9HEMI